MQRARQGFTLIELMVVILIIGLLAAVLAIAIPAVFSENKGKVAKLDIQMMSTGIDRFEREFRVYPPNTLRELPRLFNSNAPIPDNNVNAPSEAMLLALRARRGGGPFIEEDQALKEGKYANLDDDLELPNVFQIDGKALPLELIDPWGNAYVYLNLVGLKDKVIAYQLADKSRITVEGNKLLAALDDKESGRKKAHTYVIWSFGEDGVNEYGSGDDIASWH